MASRGADVVAIELDPVWAERLEERARTIGPGRVQVVHGDFLSVRMRSKPYRVVGCPPFGQTTALLRRLLDRPDGNLRRADLIVQWEVARKRAARPPGTLLSTTWAPWWEFHLGAQVRASQFRPIPKVDGGLLTILRRDPPLLPTTMVRPYADFVSANWPFQTKGTR